MIDGLYTLHLLMGDAWFDTETSIRGTEGQMLLDGKHIPAGHFERFSITVPAVQGKIVLTFSGRAPGLMQWKWHLRHMLATCFGRGFNGNEPACGRLSLCRVGANRPLILKRMRL